MYKDTIYIIILLNYFLFIGLALKRKTFPCHRLSDRCLGFMKKSEYRICSRCFAMTLFIGLAIIFNKYIYSENLIIGLCIGVLFQLPMIIDGVTQLKGYRSSNNFLRVVTGSISGIGLGTILISVIELLYMYV